MLKELLQVSAGPFVFVYLQEPMVQLGCKPPNLRIRGLNVFDQFSKNFKQLFLRRFFFYNFFGLVDFVWFFYLPAGLSWFMESGAKLRFFLLFFVIAVRLFVSHNVQK